jgi:hypothetical protein
MATFFGTVQGGRGKATRLGHGSTGLHVTAQSYSGSIIVNLHQSDQNGNDYCTISVAEGSASGGGHTLYSGPIKDLFNDQVNLGR